MKKKIRKYWWVVVIVFIVGAAIFFTGRKKPIVELSSAQAKTITKSITTSGELKAPPQNNIYAPLAGQIEQVYVQEGESVVAGQLIYSYQAESLNQALKGAESALLVAKQAQQAVRQTILDDTDLKYYQSAVDGARAARDKARFDYEQDETEANKALWNSAITAHELALKNYYTALESNPNSLDLTTANEGVEAAEAALATAQKNYQNKGVVAPVAGTVSLSRDTTGQLALVPQKVTVQGQAVATVIDSHSLRFEAEVDETDVAHLVAGQDVEVELDPYLGETFAGIVEFVSGTSTVNSSGSEVYIVVIRLANPASTFRAGFSGQASFKIETVKDVLSIPSRAILVEDDEDIVYVYRDGRVEKRVVTLGLESATDAQVLTGISLGEQVVVSNNVRDFTGPTEVEVAP